MVINTQLNGEQILDKSLMEVDIEFGTGSGEVNTTSVPTITTNFNNNLSPADVTVQKALDTLDDIIIAHHDFNEDWIIVNQFGQVVTNGINVLTTSNR